jgi:hypothetical protein
MAKLVTGSTLTDDCQAVDNIPFSMPSQLNTEVYFGSFAGVTGQLPLSQLREYYIWEIEEHYSMALCNKEDFAVAGTPLTAVLRRKRPSDTGGETSGGSISQYGFRVAHGEYGSLGYYGGSYVKSVQVNVPDLVQTENGLTGFGGIAPASGTISIPAWRLCPAVTATYNIIPIIIPGNTVATYVRVEFSANGFNAHDDPGGLAGVFDSGYIFHTGYDHFAIFGSYIQIVEPNSLNRTPGVTETVEESDGIGGHS